MSRRRSQRAKPKRSVFLVAIAAIIVIAVAMTVAIFLWPELETEQVTKDDPSTMPFAKAAALYEKGEFEKVLPELERLVEEGPDDVEARSMLASSYMLKGEAQKAEGEYSKILKISPDHADSRYRLGILLRQQDRIDEAVKELQKAVELEPESPLFLSELAKAYVKKGRFDDAIISWKTALSLFPKKSSARVGIYIEIGDAYVLIEKPAEARVAYESGLEIDADNDHLKSRLNDL